jgi:hypothetical protein
MGSTTTGKFNNYPPSQEKKGGGSGPPGGEPDDQCRQTLSNINLEDVERSAYYQAHKNVPPAGSAVTLRTTLLGPRLSIDDSKGLSIGLLPTQYNYLVVCMKKKFSYAGEVASSSLKPSPTVRINLRVI